MNWTDLEPLLDRLEDTRRPAEVTDTIRRAKKNMEFKGGFGKFIRMVILKDEGKPDLNVVPPTQRVLLDPLLKRAYIAWQGGAFNHRNNPDIFYAYCEPYSDKYGRYLDEMEPKQRNTIAMMSEDTRRWEVMQSATNERYNQAAGAQYGIRAPASEIERALKEAIRKKDNEEGSNTA